MEFNITRDHFRIDTILPAIQTAAVYGTVEVLGRLGQYRVTLQTAMLVGTVASVVASLVTSLFRDLQSKVIEYGAILLGVATGILVHRFFYPAIATQAVLDTKGAMILTAVLAAVKLAADAIKYYHLKDKVEEKVKDAEQKIEGAAEKAVEVGAGLVEKAAAKVEENAADVKNAAAAAQQ